MLTSFQSRRSLLMAGSSLVLSSCASSTKVTAPADTLNDLNAANSTIARVTARLALIERVSGGRLGVSVLDAATGRGFGHRDKERFGMCSTFKLSLAALVLREADVGRLDLDEVLAYTKADLLPHSPTTTLNLDTSLDKGGMTVLALAETSQITSDNAAANLLLKRLGGPQRVTSFWREFGDAESRLDRVEPEMNLVPPGEVRDTVLPDGIARSVAAFVVGDILKPPSRARLVEWMSRTTTGARRIRAAVPSDWSAGDKTGSMVHESLSNKVNDLAVIYPPGRTPIVVAAFYEADGSFPEVRPQDEAVLARVGEIAVAWAAASAM